jgi:Ca2+-binding EF-hand superfamily protein
MSKNVFNLLLLETTLDDKSLSSIYRSAGTQFSKQELNNVFWISVHSMNSKRP